ncbi:MAG: response regulator [Saprospiraceae bacterium]|nr:response regulator [Saprospiraceae bacterium]
MENSNRDIFVVDDDNMYAAMLADHLEAQGYSVKTFSTGEQCLENLDENPYLIILDYYLDSEVPGAKNGLEILKEIKKTDEDIKVIMLSSQEHYGVALQTIAKGAIYYVIKDLQSFKEIDSLLEGME